MAYPTIDKPYGFRPVNLLGGQVFAGSTRQMAITGGHATSIFFGEVVSMSASGTIWSTGAISTTAPVQVAGIFMGCSYVNTQGQRVFSQYYPASTTGTVDTSSGIIAYVADDPDLVMRVAIVSSGTTVAQAARSSLVGGTVAFIDNAGSTITGDSQQAVLNAGQTTTTLPFKIIDVIPDTSPASGSFVEVLVTWNMGIHMYRLNAGI
jgi:hypothetical protein